jgi:hypothetical protein
MKKRVFSQKVARVHHAERDAHDAQIPESNCGLLDRPMPPKYEHRIRKM